MEQIPACVSQDQWQRYHQHVDCTCKRSATVLFPRFVVCVIVAATEGQEYFDWCGDTDRVHGVVSFEDRPASVACRVAHIN